eukprot:CAMPEP_0198135128 /NCGR_PEP_ID=MMETSP1442-20131203/60433_1 /TAXON_ID= /ORGANISM="Craspedostauros australis, Strain CCMP3328" /LENGTH=316 /DNA_ID=CAMNT_0043796289 /DNA_START=202 /DNA_END=1152 /DNA_ORIENTATION=-
MGRFAIILATVISLWCIDQSLAWSTANTATLHSASPFGPANASRRQQVQLFANTQGGGWKSQPGEGGGWKSRPGEGGGWKSQPGEGGGWKSQPAEGGERKSKLSDSEKKKQLEKLAEMVKEKNKKNASEVPPKWDDRVMRLNIVTMIGRLGSDPVAKYFDDGKLVVNVNLAVKRKYAPAQRLSLNLKSGQEETDWFGLEIWGKTAEFVEKYADKGARVSVIGSLRIDRWSDKVTGKPRMLPKIVVREFEILETKAEGDARRAQRRGPSFFVDNSDDSGGSSSSGGGAKGQFDDNNDDDDDDDDDGVFPTGGNEFVF